MADANLPNPAAGPAPIDNSKHIILSKTLWINLIIAISAIFVPKIHDYIVANPDIMVYVISGVNMLLRLITKGSVYISE